MNLEFSQKAGTWITLAVLALFVGGYLGIYSGLNYLKAQGTRLASQKDVYLKQQDRLEKLKDFQSKLTEAEAIIATMNEALPVAEQKASVVSLLSNLASKAGAQVNGIVDQTSEDAVYEDEAEEGLDGSVDLSNYALPELAVQEIQVTIAGSYPKIKSFFRSLEANRRPLDPIAFELTSKGIQLTLNHYYLTSSGPLEEEGE